MGRGGGETGRGGERRGETGRETWRESAYRIILDVCSPTSALGDRTRTDARNYVMPQLHGLPRAGAQPRNRATNPLPPPLPSIHSFHVLDAAVALALEPNKLHVDHRRRLELVERVDLRRDAASIVRRQLALGLSGQPCEAVFAVIQDGANSVLQRAVAFADVLLPRHPLRRPRIEFGPRGGGEEDEDGEGGEEDGAEDEAAAPPRSHHCGLGGKHQGGRAGWACPMGEEELVGACPIGLAELVTLGPVRLAERNRGLAERTDGRKDRHRRVKNPE